jgi:amidase
MRTLSRQSLAASAHVDVVLCPSLAKEPALVGGLRDDADPAADFEAQKHFTPFTSPYNISGQPSVSLPLQWTTSGLPIGVQIVGRPRGESTMLSLAGQLERARPWMHRRHELW